MVKEVFVGQFRLQVVEMKFQSQPLSIVVAMMLLLRSFDVVRLEDPNNYYCRWTRKHGSRLKIYRNQVLGLTRAKSRS